MAEVYGDSEGLSTRPRFGDEAVNVPTTRRSLMNSFERLLPEYRLESADRLLDQRKATYESEKALAALAGALGSPWL